MNDENEGTTHATGCYSWGGRHYRCALEEVRRLRAALWDCLQAAGHVADVSVDAIQPDQDVARWALDAVRELREAYREAGGG